jgi:hypothetical protein
VVDQRGGPLFLRTGKNIRREVRMVRLLAVPQVKVKGAVLSCEIKETSIPYSPLSSSLLNNILY